MQWHPTPASAGSAAARGRYLLIPGNGNALQRLAALLAQAGIECCSAQDLTNADPPIPCNGILYTEALEAPSFDLLPGISTALSNLAAQAGAKPLPVWVITAGAQHVLSGDAVDPVQAAVSALAQKLRLPTVDLGAAWEEAVPFFGGSLMMAEPGVETAWRGRQRYTAPAAQDNTPANRLRLHIRERGSLDNLELLPAQRKRPGQGQIEIEVSVTAMSFRDVLNLLGMYPGDPGPLGGECAGRVVSIGEGVDRFRVGDEVVAVAAGAHDGYVLAYEYMAAHRPPALELEDALTFPSSFLTAVFTLEHLAKVRAGQRVLIHSGAGGVGLAAIQVAQRAGAEVFATAGTEEKRAFLQSLGVRHTMTSRTPEFLDYIQKETQGKGVDIVLNSLANELLDASFEAIAVGGVFLEIGKNGLWSPERVAGLGKSIQYYVVDWGDDARESPQLIGSLLAKIMEDAGSGQLRPLPKKVFSFPDAPAAFRHIARARHIGRVLLRQTTGELPIRGEGTYVIAGDLKNEGLQAARWLADRGARELLLLDNVPPSPEALRAIRLLARQGVRTLPGRIEDAERVLNPIKNQLHGVIYTGCYEPLDHLWRLYEVVNEAPLDFFEMFLPDGDEHRAGAALAIGLAHAFRSRGIQSDCRMNSFASFTAQV